MANAGVSRMVGGIFGHIEAERGIHGRLADIDNPPTERARLGGNLVKQAGALVLAHGGGVGHGHTGVQQRDART